MEGIIDNRVTPMLKCLVLLLFIFTAKVLTSRPVENFEGNEIPLQKPTYVRTFTKYHHRRTINWHHDNDHWPVINDHDRIKKRNVEEQYLSGSLDSVPNSLENAKSLSTKNKVIEKSLSTETKKYKVKAAIMITDPPTTDGPRISCLYKLNSVKFSVTPAYEDEKNTQQVVENDYFEVPGPLSESTLNGETVEIEQCTVSKASCYTLWHEDNSGNITVLGQGCWRSSQNSGPHGCDKCTSVAPTLPSTKFCCCTKELCNADFTNIEEYVATPKAEWTMDSTPQQISMPHIVALGVIALVAMLVVALILKIVYCKKVVIDKDDISDSLDVEKVDVMGSGPDALATGLLCVDNLTLNEHIGQGKFGSVWSGSLGTIPVAVKLYSSASTWQKEAAVYCLPHLSHPNILKYYGSDTRPILTEGGGREHLIVLELCAGTLRRRLEESPLSWQEFATLAHGLAAALAHLHSIGVNKPCIVHRDVNSNNVLVAGDGSPRLADLGLAQLLHARRSQTEPRRITEAGTLRYLAPEALEGALDLSGARAALCAVDVFALGLVVWEMLWRTNGAHPGAVPPYSPPYLLQGLGTPTMPQMQNLVSRNKVRPPLPKGPVIEWRALKIASDTCDECWDHDAEARLTAVCVEERMAELKHSLQAHGPVIHDNNLHPHSDTNASSSPEAEKNSNCTSTQQCDVTTPLLYSQPHMGRNPCMERNTHTSQTHAVELIHKSLKDIAIPHNDEPRLQNIDNNCLSVARDARPNFMDSDNSDRINDIRSHQRPLDFISNDVNAVDVERKPPKQTNLLHDIKFERPKWGIRKFFERKLHMNAKPLDTEVKLLPDVSNSSNQSQPRTKTTIINEKICNLPQSNRPTNLVLSPESNLYDGPCTLSPPNRTLSPTMLIESEINKSESRIFGYKELPTRNSDDPAPKPNQIFAVIVPKSKPNDYREFNLIEMRKTRGSTDSLSKSGSIYKSGSAGNSESEDSTFKKRLSSENKISNESNSGRSSRASANFELQYINNEIDNIVSPFENSDCSSSEDEHLLLLSENGGSKITMQTVQKHDVLKETSQPKAEFCFGKNAKYVSFDNEFSDPHDKENLDAYCGDNPVYVAAFTQPAAEISSQKPSLRTLAIKRQHSLEQVSEIFTSASDVHLQNPAGRVKTPGDLPAAVRRARRDKAMQKGRANNNRLSLYDDRMMFGNSL